MSNTENLKKLREPFLPNQISKLPKPYKKDSPKGKCPECGGYHGLPAMHLDYVGHAALTDRLLDVDPLWTWEPVSFDQNGLPSIDKDGGLWIKLTVCGVTRLGYGDAQGKSGGDATKERIGDALRNAAMRFGAALDLWHKGILHIEDDQAEDKPKAAPKQTTPEPKPSAKLSDDDMEILPTAMQECDDFDALKSMFSSAYKKGSPEQKSALKAVYDSIKTKRNWK